MKLKSIGFCLGIIMTLSACSEEAKVYTYGDVFSIEYPSSWETITDLTELPRGAIVVFVSPVSEENVSNIVITTKRVPEEWTVEDVLATAADELSAYPLLTEEDSSGIRIADQKTELKDFTIETKDDKKQRMLQTYLIQKGTAYTITAYLPPNADELEKSVMQSIESFTFLNIEAEEEE